MKVALKFAIALLAIDLVAKLSAQRTAVTIKCRAPSHLRETDTLVVWKLDRLGRCVKGLVDLVNELEARKVHFQSITDGVDTKTPAGRFFFHVMASLAQMERALILERTRDRPC